MHEFDIAQKILEIVKQELALRKINKVERIKVNISKFLFIDDNSMKEAFNLVSRGSPAENADLEINQTEGPSEIRVEEIEVELTEQS